MANSRLDNGRLDAHAFSFYGGDLLARMGASWFVSYAYCKYVDEEHTNWNRVATSTMRRRIYDKSFSYHRYWLDKILSMDSRRIEQNEIGLSALDVKHLAEAVLERSW